MSVFTAKIAEAPAGWFDLILANPWPLLLIIGPVFLWLGYRFGYSTAMEGRLAKAHEGSRRSLAGKTAEQWAPYLDGFPGLPTEARFLGAPIDYLVFEGLDEGFIDEVVFVEVKSGKGQLTSIERSLRDAIREGRVRWVEHRVEAPS